MSWDGTKTMGYKRILLYFLTWRALLFLSVYLGVRLLILQNNFLGGGLGNYLTNPYLWSSANFDGEHYLTIAREGYRPLTYFFFPMYPALTKLFTIGINGAVINYLISGLFISHTSFVLGAIGLIKLVRLDYTEKISWLTVILLLAFPTSYYFVSMYTESLFFMLSVWSIYFFRQKHYLLSGILGAFSSATRIFGLALTPYFIIQLLLEYKKRKSFDRNSLFTVFFVPIGLLGYIYYLYNTTGDPLAFFHNLSIYGDQRSNNLVLFPQVFYRYIFKIIPSLTFNYFPTAFTTFLEIVTATVFLYFILLMFHKKMYSYGLYSISLYIISSLSGSFSSFPRYALSIFPVFVVSALYLSKLNMKIQYLVFVILVLCLMVTNALFSRGYWIS